jgi:hypothetical protein
MPDILLIMICVLGCVFSIVFIANKHVGCALSLLTVAGVLGLWIQVASDSPLPVISVTNQPIYTIHLSDGTTDQIFVNGKNSYENVATRFGHIYPEGSLVEITHHSLIAGGIQWIGREKEEYSYTIKPIITTAPSR